MRQYSQCSRACSFLNPVPVLLCTATIERLSQTLTVSVAFKTEKRELFRKAATSAQPVRYRPVPMAEFISAGAPLSGADDPCPCCSAVVSARQLSQPRPQHRRRQNRKQFTAFGPSAHHAVAPKRRLTLFCSRAVTAAQSPWPKRLFPQPSPAPSPLVLQKKHDLSTLWTNS